MVELGASLRVFGLNPNRVLATRDYLLSQPADGTPSDGVAAANELVARLIDEVVTFAHDQHVDGCAHVEFLNWVVRRRRR